MTEPFERELAVFSAARQLPKAERAAYLDQTCAGEPVLRQRVEELLRAGEEAESFLKEPAAGAQRPEGASAATSPDAPGEKAGNQIGHYKLLQQIGEGGCGLVYMAEQEEPVRRRVALKVIKLGMDTKQVIARFEAERQALAMMDHPNIARVFEAGATEAGRPYFVMELVRGIKITDYCDEHNLSTNERLDLFTQVCRAVQHAHQKGVIHRDLKPSNILVASNDGVPVPKVIDFGIAKATQGRLTDQTLFTAFEQFVGTPAYMSPEQAELTMQDVDTRTDIYSLGVLLYELLTSRTPFDGKELLASGLDAMRRTIREQEPKRPSTKLSTMLEGELTTTAKHRRTDAPKLIHLLRGDLDWIVMKCLEKDRARRYETANGLARDIERHLGNEPVMARPPSRLYEFQKTVRRHWVGFAAVTAVLAALVIGTLVSTLSALEARRAGAREAKARSLAEQRLYEAKLSEARAKRLTGVAGQRFESLAAIAEAAGIHPSPELRDEVVACLGLTDLRLQQSLPVPTRWVGEGVAFDSRLELYAYETNGGMSVRSLIDRREIEFIPVKEGDTALTALWCLQFDPRSRYLCARVMRGEDHAFHSGEQIHWRVWDVTRSGAVVLDVPGEIAAFSPDGEQVAIAQADGTISIQELASSNEPRRLTIGERLSQLCFSPDGAWIAGCGPGSSIVGIWEAGSGQLDIRLLDAYAIHTLAWSPDSSLLATGSAAGQISLWNVRRGKLQMRLEGHSGNVVGITFDHQGSLLASESWDTTARLWELASGKQLVVCPIGTTPSIHFSLDDRSLGGFFDGTNCQVLEVAHPTGYRRLSHLGHPASSGMDFTSDGRVAAVAGEGGTLLVDIQGGKGLGVVGADSGWAHFSSAPDCALWTSTEAGLCCFRLRFNSQVRQPRLRVEAVERLQALGSLDTFAFDRENRKVVMPKHGSGGAFLWDLQDRSAAPRFCAHAMVGCGAMDPAGRWAATGTWKGEGVKVWEFSTGRWLHDLPVSGSAGVLCSPDGHWLATSAEGNFRLWDTGSWSPAPHSLAANGVYIGGAMAFSPDSGLLATCHDEQGIVIANVPNLQPVARLFLPSSANISALCFGPGGSTLGALERNGNIHLWDLGTVRAELKKNNLDWEFPPISPAGAMISGGGPGMVLDAGPFSRQELAERIPPRDTNAPATLIDLTDYYNAPLNQNWHLVAGGGQSDLSELPTGRRELAGVEFDVRGLIQIGFPGANGLSYPDHIESIRIGRPCRRLHFLHAALAAASARAGDKLGSYTIQYVDGREVEIPIIAGTDVVDWWSQPDEAGMKRVIAWEGNTPEAKKLGHTVRLFTSTWENPYPAVVIRQFDFATRDPSHGAPFLVAVTAEP